MKITGFRSTEKDGRARVSATVAWEDCARATQEIYFETDMKFSDSLSCDPHSFLVGCIVPALHYGEKRILIEADICPELRKGLVTAMTWLRQWFYEPGRELVRIEAGVRSGITGPRPPERAGFFFSGGIDSFATLRTNRLNFPAEHARSLKDGLLVFGLEQVDPELFKYVLNSMAEVAEAADITLIPIYTNIYKYFRQEDATVKFRFWTYEFQGAALSAVAHALSNRLTVVSIPSSDALPNDALLNRKHINPYGSHPVLDPNYSSAELRIQHDGITLSRLEKTRIVSEWDSALQNLRVCNMYRLYRPGALNCGKCEKCFRTMLALKILNVIDNTGAFPVKDLEDALERQKQLNPYYYLEMLPHLRAQGCGSLARKIEKKISLYRKRQMITSWRNKIADIASNITLLSAESRRSKS